MFTNLNDLITQMSQKSSENPTLEESTNAGTKSEEEIIEETISRLANSAAPSSKQDYPLVEPPWANPLLRETADAWYRHASWRSDVEKSSRIMAVGYASAMERGNTAFFDFPGVANELANEATRVAEYMKATRGHTLRDDGWIRDSEKVINYAAHTHRSSITDAVVRKHWEECRPEMFDRSEAEKAAKSLLKSFADSRTEE